MDITTLSFENVRFHQYDTESCHLYFTIDGYHYYLFLYKEEHVFVPQYVQHYDEKEEMEYTCPCCDSPFDEAYFNPCFAFKDFLYELVDALIALPSVRLQFLYLPYHKKENAEAEKKLL